MQNIKKALSLELPVKVGEKAVITLDSNERASTSVKEIMRIEYNNNYLYITIRTKNSIYPNVPVPVVEFDNFYDGQIIEPGRSVVSDSGNYIEIFKITEITSGGIKILDVNQNEYIGEIKAA